MNRIFISFSFGLMLAVLAHAQSTPNLVCNINERVLEKVGDKYYMFVQEMLNWFDASDRCRENNMHLASLANSKERVDISDGLLSRHFKVQFWLSGYDLGKKDVFKWAGTGKELNKTITKSDWGKGQPDNAGMHNEHCVQLSPENGKFILNDAACESKFYSLCEASTVSLII